jgi:L-lactate dehydrogenase complex protein LldF
VTPELPKDSFRDRWSKVEQELYSESAPMNPEVADRLSKLMDQRKNGGHGQ